MGIKGKPWERKILISILTITISMSLVSCAKESPVATLESTGVENIWIENIETETIETENIIEEDIIEEIWISEEYLKEVEFNSRKNQWVS